MRKQEDGRQNGSAALPKQGYPPLLGQAHDTLRCPYAAKGIWSPAGGFYADPKKWKRNTALAAA